MHAERKHLSVVHVSCRADSDLVLVVYRVTEQLRSSFYASMIDFGADVWDSQRRKVKVEKLETKGGNEVEREREVDDGGMRAAKEESEGVMERGGDTCEGGESVETGGKHYRTWEVHHRRRRRNHPHVIKRRKQLRSQHFVSLRRSLIAEWPKTTGHFLLIAPFSAAAAADTCVSLKRRRGWGGGGFI